ncbi:MAG: chromate transporter [Rhizobiales bacterium]|nr:chromate transporter [Hyphomicrobiales bacterium]
MNPPAGPLSPSLPPSNAPPPVAAATAPSIAELFLAFATISLSGFGGVLAWARRIMVERRRWFTAEAFNEAFALCAFLPGGNMVNFAVIFGARMRGPLGALAAVAGLLGPPMILIMAVGALYAHYGDLPALRRALTGVAAAAAGLMLATVAKMARPLFKGPFKKPAVIAPLIAFVTFAAIGILHWPLPLVLLVIVPLSIGAAFRNIEARR